MSLRKAGQGVKPGGADLAEEELRGEDPMEGAAEGKPGKV